MNIEHVRDICLSFHRQIEEGCPFADLGHQDIAFTIAGKIFAFLCVPDSPSLVHSGAANLIVLKCDANLAVELRERYPGIIEPAWHWNKKYWNQVRYDMLHENEVRDLIQHSFDQVVAKLTKKLRTELNITLNDTCLRHPAT